MGVEPSDQTTANVIKQLEIQGYKANVIKQLEIDGAMRLTRLQPKCFSNCGCFCPMKLGQTLIRSCHI